MPKKVSQSSHITVIGAGLAGCEAAWQAARLGLRVNLLEMRPLLMTPAHSGDRLSELVCSNSLGSMSPDHPSGQLKQELRSMDSLIIKCADACRVPAGGALAVDRSMFSSMVGDLIANNPLICLIRQEVKTLDGLEAPIVIASGPLTSPALMAHLESVLGTGSLYMYDAVAPIVDADSIDTSKVYSASRYGKGEPDYINCPMDESEYRIFYEALVSAERVPLSIAEDMRLFEACLPIEEMADRGFDTIRFGPMKPVGLVDPRTDKLPFAVVQLRKEDLPGTSYNLVGFQTRLKWPEQKKVFSMIPGLEHARFMRYGVVHRNSYINSPALIDSGLMFRDHSGLFIAGQLTGSEGYVESTATGAIAGVNAARFVSNSNPARFPADSCMGAIAEYISKGKGGRFDPMSISFGLLPDPKVRARSRKDKRDLQIAAAQTAFKIFISGGGAELDAS